MLRFSIREDAGPQSSFLMGAAFLQAKEMLTLSIRRKGSG